MNTGVMSVRGHRWGHCGRARMVTFMGALCLLSGLWIEALYAETVSQGEVHCIVGLGQGTINWTTGVIEISTPIVDGEGAEKMAEKKFCHQMISP